jgi:uncharacterized protein YggE
MTALRRWCFPLAAIAAAVAVPLGSAATERTITVHGVGIVHVTPTIAEFTFGVAANGSTAAAALRANGAKMNVVIAAIKKRGVAAANIQTAQIFIQPNRNRAGDKVLNYTAMNSVTARIKGIDNAGRVLDAAVAVGVNEINGPTLTIADERVVSRKALRKAIADARARAEAIAAAAGIELGEVRTVSEEITSTPLPYAALADRAESTPVSAGTIAIQADVTVTFAIE